MTLYHDEILEHYRHPQNFGAIVNPDVTATERNSSCGDEFTFTFRIADNIISDVKFSGRGCAISMASASMLTEEIIGKTIDEIHSLQPSTVLELLGVPTLTPTRLQCALLPLQAVTRSFQKNS